MNLQDFVNRNRRNKFLVNVVANPALIDLVIVGMDIAKEGNKRGLVLQGAGSKATFLFTDSDLRSEAMVADGNYAFFVGGVTLMFSPLEKYL